MREALTSGEQACVETSAEPPLCRRYWNSGGDSSVLQGVMDALQLHACVNLRLTQNSVSQQNLQTVSGVSRGFPSCSLNLL